MTGVVRAVVSRDTACMGRIYWVEVLNLCARDQKRAASSVDGIVCGHQLFFDVSLSYAATRF